jgi:N-acetylneuraminate lyase
MNMGGIILKWILKKTDCSCMLHTLFSSCSFDKLLTIPVNGTSGEGMSMTVAERKAVTEAWAAAVKETKQILMVQVGGTCLKDVQELVNSSVTV